MRPLEQYVARGTAVDRKGRLGRAAPPLEAKQGPQVLLADDSEAVRVLTSALLQGMGCSVDAVEHGEQALGLARHVRYDLILLDLDMPLMDGLETAREIRALPDNGSTPIMAVSAFLEGFGDPDERCKLFDGEIAKPLKAERLREVVLNAWPAPTSPAGAPQEGDHHLPLVDMAVVNAIVQRLGSAASTTIETAMAEMRACAGQIELAIRRDDRVPVRLAAHKLSRVALSCGAARLARRAALLAAKPHDVPMSELQILVSPVLNCSAATIALLKKSRP